MYIHYMYKSDVRWPKLYINFATFKNKKVTKIFSKNEKLWKSQRCCIQTLQLFSRNKALVRRQWGPCFLNDLKTTWPVCHRIWAGTAWCSISVACMDCPFRLDGRSSGLPTETTDRCAGFKFGSALNPVRVGLTDETASTQDTTCSCSSLAYPWIQWVVQKVQLFGSFRIYAYFNYSRSILSFATLFHVTGCLWIHYQMEGSSQCLHKYEHHRLNGQISKFGAIIVSTKLTGRRWLEPLAFATG